MQLRLKLCISVMLLCACVSTCVASGLPEDPISQRQASLMSSMLVGIKNAPRYPFLFVRQFADRLGNQVQIDPITAKELVELFRVTGGY